MLSAAFRFLLPGLSLAFACAPGVGLAAEALALKVLGFSPDGRHFGFIQYGGVGDGGEYTAEAYVIDVERDRVMPRMPLVLASWKEELAEDPRPYGEWLLAFAEKRFAKALAPYRLRPSVPLFADRSARTDETFAISSDVRLAFGSGSVRFDDAKLGRANLDLEEKRFTWPRSSRASSDPAAISCAEEVDWEKGAGFRLMLRRGANTLVLHDDRTIPASRHCVLGYSIAAVHSYARPDGKVSLAAVLGMAVRAFEGSDRRFLAVTAVLSP